MPTKHHLCPYCRLILSHVHATGERRITENETRLTLKPGQNCGYCLTPLEYVVEVTGVEVEEGLGME